MPQANCQAELTPGKLVQVLPDWGVAEGILDLVFTYRRVRAVVDFARRPVAGGPGFEPRLTESESAVLPLNYPPKRSYINNFAWSQACRPGLPRRDRKSRERPHI